MQTNEQKSRAGLKKAHAKIRRELIKIFPNYHSFKVKRSHRDDRVVVLAKDANKRHIKVYGHHYNVVLNFVSRVCPEVSLINI